MHKNKDWKNRKQKLEFFYTNLNIYTLIMKLCIKLLHRVTQRIKEFHKAYIRKPFKLQGFNLNKYLNAKFINICIIS